MVLGTLVLWFAWSGFKCSSTPVLSTNVANLAAKTAFTTTMTACISSAAMLAIWIVFEHNSALNGILGSLVSITTNCSVVNTPHAGITMLDLRKSLYYQQATIVLCTSSKRTQPKHYIAVATRPIPSVPLAPSVLRNTRVVHLTEEKEVFYFHLYYMYTHTHTSCSSPASLPPSSRLCPLCSLPPVLVLFNVTSTYFVMAS